MKSLLRFVVVTLLMLPLSAMAQFTVTLNVNNAAYGTVAGAGEYDDGDEVTITASPNPGYEFQGWYEGRDLVSPSSSYTFTIEDDVTFTARFREVAVQYTVTATIRPNADAGTVTGLGTFPAGNITLSATAIAPYRFVRWLDADENPLATTSQYEFALNSNVNFIAEFEYVSQDRAITVQASPAAAAAELTATPNPATENTPVEFNAVANDGWGFLRWEYNGATISTDANCTYTIPVGDAQTYTAYFAPERTVTLSGNYASTSEWSLVNNTRPGSTNFYEGDNVTFTVTPNDGYNVETLTFNGTNITSPYTFTVGSSDIAIVADFESSTPYTVTLTRNPNNNLWGSVSKTPINSPVPGGTTLTLSAAPGEGKAFDRWEVKVGDVVVATSTDNPYYYSVTNNVAIVGYFVNSTPVTYALTVEASPDAGGSVTGSGNYAAGASVPVTATANANYRFVDWSNGNTNASFNYTMPAAATTLTANFIRQYTVTATAGTGGTVTGAGTYDEGSNVSVVATANEGYRFKEWNDHSTNATYTISDINADYDLTASFVATYTFAFSQADGGTMTTSHSNGTYDNGTAITVDAVAAEHYRFVCWKVNDVNQPSLSASNYQFTLAANTTIEPVFMRQYSITASANPAAGGTVAPAGTTTYDETTTNINYTATANEGYRFTGWNIAPVNDNPYVFTTISGDVNLVANFIATYTFAVEADGQGTVSFTPSAAAINGRYDAGTDFTVTATPATGYHIDHWTVNGVNANDGNVTDIAANTLVKVYFAIDGFDLAATAGEGGQASVNVPTVTYGGSATFTATPDDCHNFVEWSDGSTDAVHQVTNITSDLTLNATFELKTYTVTVGIAANGSATATANVVNCDGTVTVEATANEGYHFVQWNDGNDDNPRIYNNVRADIIITPEFQIDAPQVNYYNVTLNVGANGTVVSTPAVLSNLEENSTVNFTATPDEGYRTVWTVAGESTTGNTKVVTVTSDLTVDVTFEAIPPVSGHLITINVIPAGDENITVLGDGITNVSAGVFTTTIEDHGSKTLTAYANGNPNYTLAMWQNAATFMPMSMTEACTLTDVTTDLTLLLVYNVTPSQDVDYLTYEDATTKVVVTGVNEDYRAIVTNLVIPASVTTINNRAFHDCSSLANIIIPATVETTGNYLFDGCNALTTVAYMGNNTTIGTYTFNNCTALQSVTLPESMTTLPEGTFYGCTALPTVTLPAGIESVGAYAFKGCNNIYSLTMPNAVETIGAQAFGNMSSLSFITLGSGTQSIASRAFTGVRNLVHTNFAGTLEQWMAIDFEDALANPMSQSRNLAINGQVITDLTIPAGVTAVKRYAFFFDTLITSITMNDVQTIADSAFYRLTNLNTIYLSALPVAETTAFDAVVKANVTVVVPCELYAEAVSTSWAGFTNFRAEGLPLLTLVQTPGGTVEVMDGHELSCTNPTTTMIRAIAAPNYRFVTWSDGIAANPRTLDMTGIDQLTLSAIWERNTNASTTSVRHITFEDGTTDQASFFSYSEGANNWVIGIAAANTEGTWGGTKGMYISNNAGVDNNYSDDAQVTYTYAEMKLNRGFYEIVFDYNVAGNAGDNLTVALFDDNADPDGLTLADGQILHAALNSTDNWSTKSRLINVPAEGWYRLAFFWNTTDDDDVDNPGAAIDNIFVNYQSAIGDRFAHVAVNVNDENMGYAIAYVDPNTHAEYTEHDYYYGQTIEISAVANDNYRFIGWNDGVTANPRQLNFEDLWGQNMTYTANFEAVPTSYTVTVVAENGTEDKAIYGVVAADNYVGNEPLSHEEEIAIDGDATLYVTLPLGGWAFLGWWDGANDTITDNPYHLHAYNNDVTFTAILKPYRECDGNNGDEYDNNGNPRFINISNFNTDMDEDAIITNVVIGVENRQIVVEEAMGAEVNVYDAVGRKLTSRIADTQKLYIDVPASGAYMVKIGELLTKKVVVIK